MTKEKSIKVSIIIPVFNIQSYVGECIDSCLSQTYSNFEIILIDDGSTDDSGIICDKYAKMDNRIKVIHQQNQGLSSARNNGVNSAQGEYVVFIDGDDAVYDCLLDTAVNTVESDDSDIVFFDFEHWDGKKIISNTEDMDKFKSLSTSEEFLELLLQHRLCEMVWCGIYKRNIIKNLKFPIGKINEDVYWKYRAIENAQKIKLINKKLYLYRVRGDSITHRKFDVRNLDVMEGAYYRALDVSKKYQSLKVLAYTQVWTLLLTLYNSSKIYLNQDDKRRAIHKIFKYKKALPLTLKEIFKDKKISKERKFLMIICKFSFRMSAKFKYLITEYKYSS